MDLDELLAREAIRDLVARYNANGDSGRFDAVLALFADDAVLEAEGVSYAGKDRIREMFTTAAAAFSGAGGSLRHFTSTHQIDVTSASTAVGRAYYAVLMGPGLDHWGRYLDDYVRVDDTWRFARRRVLVDGEAPGSWASSRGGPEDPSGPD